MSTPTSTSFSAASPVMSTSSTSPSASTSTASPSAPAAVSLKRKAENQGGKPMDPARRARLEARQARNRTSAQISRNRKKAHVEMLEIEVEELRKRNAELEERAKEAEDTKERLKVLEQLVQALFSSSPVNAALRASEALNVVPQLAPLRQSTVPDGSIAPSCIQLNPSSSIKSIANIPSSTDSTTSNATVLTPSTNPSSAQHSTSFPPSTLSFSSSSSSPARIRSHTSAAPISDPSAPSASQQPPSSSTTSSTIPRIPAHSQTFPDVRLPAADVRKECAAVRKGEEEEQESRAVCSDDESEGKSERHGSSLDVGSRCLFGYVDAGAEQQEQQGGAGESRDPQRVMQTAGSCSGARFDTTIGLHSTLFGTLAGDAGDDRDDEHGDAFGQIGKQEQHEHEKDHVEVQAQIAPPSTSGPETIRLTNSSGLWATEDGLQGEQEQETDRLLALLGLSGSSSNDDPLHPVMSKTTTTSSARSSADRTGYVDLDMSMELDVDMDEQALKELFGDVHQGACEDQEFGISAMDQDERGAASTQQISNGNELGLSLGALASV